MIHCIGNSHARVFTNSDVAEQFKTAYSPPFSSTSIGPVIAYNFFENHLDTCISVLSTININKNDKIMLIVGEVDCRLHLPKRIFHTNENMEIVVEECVNRFFRSILSLQSMGYNMLTWCGHPSTTQGHSDNPSCPIWGDCLQRNAISLLWMKHIIELSKKNNINHISIVEELIDINGLTKMNYYADYCHLRYDKIIPIIKDKFKNYE